MDVLSIFKKKKSPVMDLPPPPVPLDRDMPELPQIESPPMPEPPAPLRHEEEMPVDEPLPQPPEPLEIPSVKAPEPLMMAQEPVQEEGLIDRRAPVSPLFVSTNDYQAILDGISDIRKTLGDSENILSKLNEIKNTEEKVFSNWKVQMEDIERKISYVDTVIAKNQELIQ